MRDDPGTGDAVFMTRDGAVATIHFNRPAKRNAITLEMWRQLLHFVGAAE